MTLVLREAQVRELLTMQEALEALDAAFRARQSGSAINIGRHRIVTESGSLSVMAGGLPTMGVTGVKAYTAFGSAGARHVFLLYSDQDGRLLAILEADWLGRIRTGATTGLATRLLARADATRLAVIGAGVQAWSQIEAICSVRPIEAVDVYSPSVERRSALAQRIQAELGIAASSVASAHRAVAEADIVTTVTTAKDPVLHGGWLASGTHVNAVGSNWHDRREIDDEVVTRSALIVVGALDQAKREAGDLIQPVARGILNWERVSELGDHIVGRFPQRSSEDITLFKSVGIAIEDVAAANRVYALALEHGLGESLTLAG